MKTGFSDLDKIIKGLNNSSLNVIAGRPNMGKSSLAFNIAVNLAKKIPVAIFSLEMSKEYICNKFIDSSLVNTQIIIEDTPGISLENIRKKCIRLKREENIGLVIIDYLQLISTDDETNREQELSTISQRLKKLTEELNIPVLVTSQLSSEPDIRYKTGQDPRPTPKDFGYSSGIIKYADTIMLLYRDDYYNLNSDKKNVLEINVVKSTNKIADMCEKIKPVSDEKYYLRIKNAEVEIKDLAYKGAHRIYGNSLSIKVQERLDKELKSIIENDYATLYMIAQKLVQKSNEDGYIMGFRGSVGSSLVAYCLAITEIDPIKYDIPFEIFVGYYGDKEPNIVLNVAKEYKTKLEEYIVKILANSKDKLDNHTIEILEDDTITILNKLHKLTGIDPTTIDLEDKETLKTMCSADTLDIPYFNSKLVRDIILETKPTTFDELIKIAGLYYGTDLWENNAQDLIKNGIVTLNETISCRDDIMNDLIKSGIKPKMAFEIMETVRKGKPRCNKEPNWEEYKNIMKKHNIPGWYIKSCEKIRYAFPKAHLVSNTINAFRIAYYKVHYPKQFYKEYKEI